MKQPGGTVVQLASEDEVAADIGESDVELEGLVFAPDGFLYVIDGSSNSLLRVDPATGDAQVWVAEAAFEALTGIDDFGPNGGIILSADGETAYIVSDGDPDAIVAVDLATQTPSVVTTDPIFQDLDVFLVLAPNGDLIVADDSDANTIYRVTPAGVISVFLSEAELEAVAGGSIDLEGGIWFDSDGNFYVTDNDTDSVYKFFSSDPATGAVDPDRKSTRLNSSH